MQSSLAKTSYVPVSIPSGVLVDSSVFNPANLVIDGGSVSVHSLSDDETVWDMNIKNGGGVIATSDAWHDGLHPQGGTTPSSGFSKLTYTGTSNRYVAKVAFVTMGELIYASVAKRVSVFAHIR